MTAAETINQALDGQRLTVSDLMALTGLSYPAVTNGLYQLRQIGVLKTETLAKTTKRGRPRAIYTVESAGL